MRHEPIIWYAIILYFITGVSLLLHGSELNTATLSPFYQYLPSWGIGVLFIAISLLSTLAVLNEDKKHWAAMLLIPQQLLILMSGVISLSLALQGQYADGVIRPFFFIFTDQLPPILLAFFFTWSLIYSTKTKWH